MASQVVLSGSCWRRAITLYPILQCRGYSAWSPAEEMLKYVKSQGQVSAITHVHIPLRITTRYYTHAKILDPQIVQGKQKMCIFDASHIPEHAQVDLACAWSRRIRP